MDPIKHIILLMLENRSFDQMLGCMRDIDPRIEGIDPGNPGRNTDAAGRVFAQEPTASDRVDPDPMHDLPNVLQQLGNRDNGGFVQDYARSYPETGAEHHQQVMSYFPFGQLPALHGLAEHFCVCDHWFASVPGPTWTNRFFALSGTSAGRVIMPESIIDIERWANYDQDTVFDRLTDAGVPWRIYVGDVPISLALRHQRRPRNARHYRFMPRFFAHARGAADNFPAFCLIEPCYQLGAQNDDHPPHSAMRAQRLISQVYNALRRNKPLWNSTLLVVTYDEHGGFYDHVPPPDAVPPDGRRDEYTFDRCGIRVPAVLVSPWVDQGVFQPVLDHTSLLRYLADKWNFPPLGERAAIWQSIAPAIRGSGKPRTDTPESMPIPPLIEAMALSAAAPIEKLNANQRALVALGEYLDERELDEPDDLRMAMTAAAPTVEEQTKQRIWAFIDQQMAKPPVP